ncbi:hypothetical protein [Qipengyuania sp.]|uniref:hypothetical protein n=1 Tax=Qipengyuania sp. TaxID=2004515 RepID=UPI0035C82517
MKPEPIDLDALKREAEGTGDCVVQRAWLARVHEELSALRAIQERLGSCFGLPPGQTL